MKNMTSTLTAIFLLTSLTTAQNYSLSFDGDSYVNMGDPESFALDDFTISFWFNSTYSASAGDWIYVLGKQNPLRFELYGDGVLRFGFETPTGSWGLTSSDSGLNDGSWHHVTTTRNSTTGYFYLYIDEFQNVITDSISIILSEARKYKLSLILAHQFIAQLTKGGDTSVKDAIFGNVGTIISYRIGVEDAELISKQMAPVVSQYDLVNMPKYTCYIKLLIDNQNPPAFNFQPIYPEKGNFELAKAIKDLSRLKYGRERSIVENEISQRVIV